MDITEQHTSRLYITISAAEADELSALTEDAALALGFPNFLLGPILKQNIARHTLFYIFQNKVSSTRSIGKDGPARLRLRHTPWGGFDKQPARHFQAEGGYGTLL